jgi:hypothetical protein
LASKKTKAHIRYRLEDKTIVPGTTTIVGLRAKPFLLQWANRIGLEGIEMSKYVDDKADIGTLAHDMILCHFEGKECDVSDYSPKQVSQAENSLLSFFEWQKHVSVTPILTETPLVSERYKYGGTIDLYCSINGYKALVDFKTGDALYPEMAIQLSAYVQLLKESGHEVDYALILRIGRDETEGFEERRYPDLSIQWDIFKALLSVYYNEKKLR